MTTFGWVFALSQMYISLPMAHTINGSGPIFIYIIDYYLNGVQVSRRQVVSIVVVIVGLILTVNGRLIVTYFDPDY